MTRCVHETNPLQCAGRADPCPACAVGAAGAVFMTIVLSSFTGAERGTIPLTLILVTALYLGGEVVTGLAGADSVSQLSHIVGGV